MTEQQGYWTRRSLLSSLLPSSCGSASQTSGLSVSKEMAIGIEIFSSLLLTFIPFKKIYILLVTPHGMWKLSSLTRD